MQTVNELNARRVDLSRLISDWAKENKILQPGEVIEVDIRVIKNPQPVVLTINGQQDLAVVRAMSVDNVEFSRRASGILNNAEIKTIGELADQTYNQIRRYRYCGKATVNEFTTRLSELGITVDWMQKWRRYFGQESPN